MDISDFLVQDPDVVFLDGMNDDRTASSGLHVALTGHLVLSTFDAIDAPSMVARLTRLGVDPGRERAAPRAPALVTAGWLASSRSWRSVRASVS